MYSVTLAWLPILVAAYYKIAAQACTLEVASNNNYLMISLNIINDIVKLVQLFHLY